MDGKHGRGNQDLLKSSLRQQVSGNIGADN